MGANGGQRQGVWRPVATLEGTDRAGGPGPGSGVADGPQAGRAGVVTTALTMSFINQRPLSPFDLFYFMETETGRDTACCCFYYMFDPRNSHRV